MYRVHIATIQKKNTNVKSPVAHFLCFKLSLLLNPYFFSTVNAFMKIKGTWVTQDKFPKKYNFKDTKTKGVEGTANIANFKKSSLLYCECSITQPATLNLNQVS